MHLTTKQLELMRVICGADDIDLDEILERLGYETSKASLQFSIRALVGHGLIKKRGVEKRRGRQRQVIEPTEKGITLCRPVSLPTSKSFVVSVEDDELEEALNA